MVLKFETITTKARFRNPTKEFEIDEQVIEHRIDPLLGRLSLIPHEMKEKAVIYYGAPDRRALKKSAESSRTMCFFCPERVEQSTPKFLEEINSEGRFKIGNATLCFPNLFPYIKHCGVVVLDSETHSVPLKEITPKFYGNALKAGIEFIKNAYEFDKTARYPLIGANFLLPAGSSVIHPHIHAIAGPDALYKIKLLLEKSRDYKKSSGTNFWDDLIKKERELGERYITQTGNIHWYTPFAPLGNNEVRAVISGKSNFLELSEEDLNNLGKGISNILHYYHKKKFSSFNFLLYSGPLGDASYADSFCVGFQIISRPDYRPFYVNDFWWLQILGYGSVIFGFPESIAAELKAFF